MKKNRKIGPVSVSWIDKETGKIGEPTVVKASTFVKPQRKRRRRFKPKPRMPGSTYAKRRRLDVELNRALDRDDARDERRGV